MTLPARFTAHCKLTCLGGSEAGTCSCVGPRDCELKDDPNFKHARNESIARMCRWFKNEIEKKP